MHKAGLSVRNEDASYVDECKELGRQPRLVEFRQVPGLPECA